MIWHTEIRKISELKNWEDNPRTISKEAYQELKESIDDLGNFEPLCYCYTRQMGETNRGARS